MELKEGMKVKLLPLSQADDNKRETPGIVPEMKKHFDKIVTIERVLSSSDGWFEIKEDSGNWTYSAKWIESYSILPDELFRI